MQSQTETSQNLQTNLPPHFRLNERPRDIELAVLYAQAALLIPAIIVYGFRVLVMAVLGVFAAALTEGIWQFLAGREDILEDFSALTTGLMCALLLPASAPVWLPMIAAVFAIAIAKLPFGRLGRSPFCPAAAGACFAVLSFGTLRDVYANIPMSAAERAIYEQLPDRCFAYARGWLPLFKNIRIDEAALTDILSTQTMLRVGGDPKLGAVQFLFSGGKDAIGSVCALLLIACAAWLILRKACAWQATASYIATIAILSMIFRPSGILGVLSPIYAVFTGSTLLAGIFLVGSITTAPHMRSGRVVYGAACGVLTLILRFTGATEFGEVFALLMMNAAASPIDRMAWDLRQKGYSAGEVIKKIGTKLKRRLRIGTSGGIDLDEIYGNAPLTGHSTGVVVGDEMRKAVDELYSGDLTEDSPDDRKEDGDDGAEV